MLARSVSKRTWRCSVNRFSSTVADSKSEPPTNANGPASDPRPPKLEESTDGTQVYFTTRACIHGREIVEELGMVSASAVRSTSVVSDLFVAITGIFGGEARPYTSLLNQTSAEAVHRMQFAAKSQGATDVVNVKFNTTTTMNRLVFGMHCAVLCYGTAVKCRPIESCSAASPSSSC